MNKRFAVLAATLALASPALAADTYQFDKSHTTVGFQVRHIFTMLGGKFQDFSGTIKVDRAKPESSSVEFTIQAATIFTNDPKRDEHLRTPDFFDVASHPTITFRSTAVKASGKDVYEVTGDLTMRGVTKQVTLPVTFLGEGKDPWGHSSGCRMSPGPGALPTSTRRWRREHGRDLQGSSMVGRERDGARAGFQCDQGCAAGLSIHR